MKSDFNKDYFEGLAGISEKVRFKEELEMLWDLMPIENAENVLDVGCGTGRFSKFVNSKNSNAKVVSSDVGAVVLDYVPDAVVCPLENTPFPDKTFDRVYCLHVISHVESPDRALEEMNRILKPNGILVIVGPNKWFVYAMRVLSFLKLIPKYNFDKTAVYLYSLKSQEKILNDHNFKVIKKLTYGPPLRNIIKPHICLLAEKK